MWCLSSWTFLKDFLQGSHLKLFSSWTDKFGAFLLSFIFMNSMWIFPWIWRFQCEELMLILQISQYFVEFWLLCSVLMWFFSSKSSANLSSHEPHWKCFSRTLSPCTSALWSTKRFFSWKVSLQMSHLWISSTSSSSISSLSSSSSRISTTSPASKGADLPFLDLFCLAISCLLLFKCNVRLTLLKKLTLQTPHSNDFFSSILVLWRFGFLLRFVYLWKTTLWCDRRSSCSKTLSHSSHLKISTSIPSGSLSSNSSSSSRTISSSSSSSITISPSDSSLSFSTLTSSLWSCSIWFSKVSFWSKVLVLFGLCFSSTWRFNFVGWEKLMLQSKHL